jgi:hypothetical protein
MKTNQAITDRGRPNECRHSWERQGTRINALGSSFVQVDERTKNAE